MSDPFVGEIRMFAGSFVPYGWLACDGTLYSTQTYDVLFSLLGTTYGGDGANTFGVPNLTGRLPVCQGGTLSMGQTGGSTTVTLTGQQLPAHSHYLYGSTAQGSQSSPQNATLASGALKAYDPSDPPDASMAQSAVTFVGGNQPHDNMQPYLAILFIISTDGIYPTPG